MKKSSHYLILLLLLFSVTGCVVQHPKYTSISHAMEVVPGMTLKEVSDTMQSPPYDIKERDKEGNYSYVWVYRPKEVKRIPLLMRKNKGVETQGRFTGLVVSFNKNDIVTKVNSCYDCVEREPHKQKLGKQAITQILATIIAAATPALLVYLSLEPQQ